MASNIGPIILGLGAAFLFLRKKDSSVNGNGNGTEAPDAGWGGDTAGGTSSCDLLTGVWAQSNPPATSPLSDITTAPELRILPLTPGAFQKADDFFRNYFNGLGGGQPDKGLAVLSAASQLTQGLGCPWTKADDWTPRMHNVHAALGVMFSHPGLYHAS